MLEYVDGKKIQTWRKFVNCLKRKEKFINYFIKTFLEEIYQLLTIERKRGYCVKIENFNRPKGKIIINKTINNQNRFSNQICCQHFEFSINTSYNQIIKYTLIYIKQLIYPDNFTLYRQNLAILKNVDLIKWNPNDIEHLNYDRLTYVYKPIHDLCCLILNDFSLQFEKGQENFFAFVLNSWNIYEIFLREIYKKYQSDFNIVPYRIGSLNDDINWDDQNKFQPDIVLKQNNQDKIYLDAKYKMEYMNHDRDQMNYYLTQTHKERLPYGEIIYPKSNVSQNDNTMGINEKIRIRYIDLEKISTPSYLKKFVLKTIKKYKIYHRI